MRKINHRQDFCRERLTRRAVPQCEGLTGPAACSTILARGGAY